VLSRLDLDGAVAALRAGEVVALPTDTVYGLGASLATPAAVERLYELKDRPGHVPLPVVCASEVQARALCPRWPDAAGRLAAEWWPGALTIVVGARDEVARLVHGPGGRVGFRVPDLAALRELLEATGPIALTSANEHGEPPCTSVERVEEAFAGRGELAGVLDGGVRDGVVSTVVELDADGGWRILREGAVSEASLADVLGPR
jgi:L-threonylcarbamoyladenylate synthase